MSEKIEKIENKVVFDHRKTVAPLGVIAMNGAGEIGEKVNNYLMQWAKESGRDYVDTYLIDSQCPRFQSGDGKGIIKSTVRGLDLYIIIDVGNYNCKYKMFDQ